MACHPLTIFLIALGLILALGVGINASPTASAASGHREKSVRAAVDATPVPARRR
jgi:hypothetical protein